MFWGIERDMWITVLAGTVGGIPAAVLAALVAMSVLKRSNRKQQELVELQLAEQRKEASRAREQAAIAEVIVAAEDFVAVSINIEGQLAERVRVFRSAVARWRAELGLADMQAELVHWPQLFTAASILRFEAEGNEAESAAFGILTSAMAAFCGTALAWQGSDEDVREMLRDSLTGRRVELTLALKDLSPDLSI